MDIMILIAALLPVAVFLFYIFRKDDIIPEPPGQLIKAFLWGILSIPLSLCISLPLGALGFFVDTPATVWGSICVSFFGAAIPEEAAKLFILWLILRRNKYFDEHMDGIVYAVCVSLGFAAVENVMYLFGNYESWLSVGITRALFSIPGHFCFGVLMGYYYSLARFYPKDKKRNKALVYLAPVLVHGIFDSILFTIEVLPWISGILTIVFLIFCHKMWKYSSNSIKNHLQRDLGQMPDPVHNENNE